MARTLEQIDTAVQALDVQVRNTYRGLMDTMRGLVLVLESRLQAIEDLIGQEPGPSSAGSGLKADLAALRVLVNDLQARVSDLENAAP